MWIFVGAWYNMLAIAFQNVDPWKIEECIRDIRPMHEFYVAFFYNTAAGQKMCSFFGIYIVRHNSVQCMKMWVKQSISCNFLNAI